MGPVAGLVLAAGAGRRFGGAKAVAELDGERLVDRAVRTVREGGVELVYVVAGAAGFDVEGAVVVDNPDWPEGMGSSLRAGLAALAELPPDVVAALVVLVDQPGLTADSVARLAAEAAGPRAVAAATYRGRQGHPVLLGRGHWSTVTRTAVGDVGARVFLRDHADRVRFVECADVASDADVDAPAELDAFREP
jgi:nicotine blue oxidoreductase